MDLRRRTAHRVLAVALVVTTSVGAVVGILRAPDAPAQATVTGGTAPGVRPARLAPPRAPVARPVKKPAKPRTSAVRRPARAVQRPARPRVERPRQVRSAAPARQCPARPRVSSARAWAGYARGSSVTVYKSRGGGAARSLANPTRDHQDLVLGVMRYDAEWAFVRYSERPNGSVGWVRVSQLQIKPVRYRVLVQRCARRLTVFERGRPVFSAPVAVGKPSTPTPLVEAYVDYVYRWSNPNGAYGAVSVGVAAFSEVYQTFGRGGVGQIAIHGTTARYSVGRAASNGCVRMYNEHVQQLAGYARPGTPVSIVP